MYISMYVYMYAGTVGYISGAHIKKSHYSAESYSTTLSFNAVQSE